MNSKNAFLCGLDEAGRGPLAGPVYAASVILGDGFPIGILDDSKKLSPVHREEARIVICLNSIAWGIGKVSEKEIDKINIHRASLLAMERAFISMMLKMEKTKEYESLNIHAIADGLFIPYIPFPCESLVKADTKIPEVMAASILAKTARDRLMEYYGIFYPQYGFQKHKGYPTKAHKESIRLCGPSPIQRMSFKVKN